MTSTNLQIPSIVLVGRPNVGKSTLFNRLIGKRKSIVENLPGITRDRLEEIAEVAGQKINLIDTGGLSIKPKGPIERKMSEQAWRAVKMADAVFFVLDGQSGVLPEDKMWLRQLRKLEKNVIAIVNKVDTPKQDFLFEEFRHLGFKNIIPISAEHNRNFSSLTAAIVEVCQNFKKQNSDEVGEEGDSLRITLIGKPNVGKSTLLNRLLGEERSIVHDEPGTTRDPVVGKLKEKFLDLTLVDTAGIRKRASTTSRVDKVSVLSTNREIENADIILLVIDGIEGPSHQDAVVGGYAYELQKPLIVLINKWDEGNKKFSREDIKGKMELGMSFIKNYPLFFVSAKSGKNLDKVLAHLRVIKGELEKKVKTSELNRVFAEIIDHHPLPVFQGRPIKMYYATQVGGSPPTFLVFCSRPDKVHFSYKRYVQNALSEIFEYKNIPIRVVYKRKS